MKQNYSIQNEIFQLEEKKNVKFKRVANEKDIELIVIGKPYNIENKGEYMDVFSMKFYLPFKVAKNSINHTKNLESLLFNNFKDQKMFIICPKELETKNKELIHYKSYEDILDVGKKFFSNIDPNSSINVSKSSTENFNQIVEIFSDDISSIFKMFKINC